MRKPPKHMYECNSGPLRGSKLALCTPITLPFTLKGQHGRYRPAMVVLEFYDIRGREYTVTKIATDKRCSEGNAISHEIRYQTSPTENQIYWEPL